MLRKLRERRQSITNQSLHGTSEKEHINIDQIPPNEIVRWSVIRIFCPMSS